MRKKRSEFNLLSGFFIVIVFVMLIVLVGAVAPVWEEGAYNISYYVSEDTAYSHNLTSNITNYLTSMTFEILSTKNVTWNEVEYEYSEVSDWIFIEDSSTGILTLNATRDNQTGNFSFHILARDGALSSGVDFELIANATNDAPNFTSGLQSEYNLTQDVLFNQLLHASDEESHYNLSFNITFLDNCTHASWAGRESGENCTILNLTSINETSGNMTLTPERNEVGTYWANISVTDFGENYSCPHAFCDNSTYKQNKTSEVSLVVFNVFANLAVNISDCNNSILEEGVEFTCEINVTTKGAEDSIDLSSYAAFRTGAWPYNESNRDWFYANSTNSSANFTITVPINITPQKQEVGNWTVNFSAYDSAQDSTVTSQIQLFVNYTESAVTLDSISNITVYENQTIEVVGNDQDLLIWDSSVKDEILTFASNTSWVTLNETPIHIEGNNYTTATFLIDYDTISASGDANYTVRINVTDTASGTPNADEFNFTIEVLSDSAPEWNSTSLGDSNLSSEGDEIYINLSQHVSDSDGDTLTFSYTNDTEFENFNLTSAGIINFTSDDADVGFHNLTFNVSDGKMESLYYFNFTILNVVDTPSIGQLISQDAVEGVEETITLEVRDNDFLIPSGQSDYYNEILTVNTSIQNLTSVTTQLSFDFDFSVQLGNLSQYHATFTADGEHVGDYNVTVNVTDASNVSSLMSFILNVTSVNDAPVLETIPNQTRSINDTFYLDINATDEEDDLADVDLTYVLNNLTAEGDFLTINSSTGVINFSLNSTYEGSWDYNVTVNDSSGSNDSRVFNLKVYGVPNITLPYSDYVFNWTENTSMGNLDFEVNYSVNDTNLTYLFYMDKIVYSNLTDYNYTDLLVNASIRNETNFTLTLENNFTWNFTPEVTDETYGLLKNLTLMVFNPLYPDLNDSVNWKVNISHLNQNLSFLGTDIPDKGPTSYADTIEINMSTYFQDVDYFDEKTNQTVNFTLSSNATPSSDIIDLSSVDSNWILSLNSDVATVEEITVVGHEYNSSNDEIGNASSNAFNVEFVSPTTISTPSSGGGGGGGSTKLKYFSLKIVVPQEVIVVKDSYIDVFFAVQNNGNIALSGVNLSSLIEHDAPLQEVSISLIGGDYIPTLGINESRDFTMRIVTDTNAIGQYKATIFADVTSPKFSDWADFFITLREANTTEAGQLLIFTEKLIAENPECLELTELVNEAKAAFSAEDFSTSFSLSTQVVEACERALESQEQIRYSTGFFEKNLSIILVITAVVFLMGVLLYFYKRVRFNKSKLDGYV